ncbi:alanine aminotransferase 2, partial [Eurytemora carolleeae]|uniref:alanine aminotransferase 2 n=1 Tax=Eurytemora carolleeae TaxID=1294199 RepID=UPI000C784F06
PALNIENMNPLLKKMEFAVTGPLVIRAMQIEKELASGAEKSFTRLIKTNLGDAHAMGDTPITFIRQVLSLLTYPPLLEFEMFPADAKQRAQEILASCRGSSVGSYSEGTGIELIRKHVADYINSRDGYPSDWEDVFLCAGATEGIRVCLKLIANSENGSVTRTGVMIPIPQYPLYSACLTEHNMDQVGYYLEETNNWSLDPSALERAFKSSNNSLNIRAIVVINPGNPTGQVLSRQNIEDIIRFAHKNGLMVFADEVYQHNVYSANSKFHSFKKVMSEMGHPFNMIQLVSFMSCSKGYMGECGLRGGYFEIVNISAEVRKILTKFTSSMMCPTIIGQACLDMVVNPPRPGDPSYSMWKTEVDDCLASLKRRGEMIAESFNKIEGVHCNPVQGAMYAFPQVLLPEKAIAAAQASGQEPDVFYAFKLLESTGICVVPGSGFGQLPGTYHFRTSILPRQEVIQDLLARFKTFHQDFIKEFS